MDKGVPTLVIAAASVDDVLAISGFGVLLGVNFSRGQPLGMGSQVVLVGVVSKPAVVCVVSPESMLRFRLCLCSLSIFHVHIAFDMACLF